MADDLNLWLANCPMAVKGDSSILQYLDPSAHDKLVNLFHAAKK
jgi:hypothetical protein